MCDTAAEDREESSSAVVLAAVLGRCDLLSIDWVSCWPATANQTIALWTTCHRPYHQLHHSDHCYRVLTVDLCCSILGSALLLVV